MRTSLTDAFLRSLAPPAAGRLDIADLRCTGLSVRMTPRGVRSWSFRFRDPDSSAVCRVTLGSYPDVSLSDARQRATELRGQVAAGLNPIELKRKARREAETSTFAALCGRYLKEYAYRFKRSADDDERNLRLHVLPRWANRRYAEIQRRDVIELCEAMVQHGKATQANRVQALISGVFSFAVDSDLLTANPCHRLKKRGSETIGTRVPNDAELTLFWHGIVEPPVSRAVGLALRLVLATGVRSGEAAGAAAPEFEHLDDSERAAWLIPALRSKNGRAHLVPLSALGAAIVREARALAPAENYLFPSPTLPQAPITRHALSVAMARFSRELRPDTEPARLWQSDPPSPHDLRRTFATHLASLGVTSEDIASLLNHSPRGVTAVHYNLYSRAREKRAALNLWASRLKEVDDEAGGRPSDRGPGPGLPGSGQGRRGNRG